MCENARLQPSPASRPAAKGGLGASEPRALLLRGQHAGIPSGGSPASTLPFDRAAMPGPTYTAPNPSRSLPGRDGHNLTSKRPPCSYINGLLVGGCDATKALVASGEFDRMVGGLGEGTSLPAVCYRGDTSRGWIAKGMAHSMRAPAP